MNRHRKARALMEHRLRQAGGTPDADIPCRRPDPSAPAPLSFTQQRLWLVEQLFPSTHAYNVPIAYRIRGRLDIAALRRGLTEVLRRHEVLRSRIGVGSDGVPYQQVQDADGIRLRLVDARDTPPPRLRHLVAEQVREPFDLEHGPLMRAALLTIDPADHILVLVLHHIASDHWTLAIVARELSTLYETFTGGPAHSLPPLPVQYADVAEWQRRRGVAERSLAYWMDRLAGLTPLELSTDRPRPAMQTFDGARVSARLDKRLTQRLRTLAEQADGTVFMALLAGFQTVLSRWSGRHDVTVGAVSADRPTPELERLAGFFVNTLALRADLSDDPDFITLLRRSRAAVLEAHEHSAVPFDTLVSKLGAGQDLSRPPLFNVALSYLSGPPARLRLAGAEVAEFDFDPGVVRFDIDLFLREDDDGVALDADYRTDLFDRATIERLLDHFARLLAGVVADPHAPISTFSLSGPAELDRLRRWGTRPAAYPADRLVHELVAARARRHPERVAVVDAGAELTYARLNDRADRLATRLRAAGVGRDVLVGVCMPRSADLVVTLLAVLKAGGAYLPLDPDYPPERLAFMLTDSAGPVLVTTADTERAGALPTEGVTVLYADQAGCEQAADRPPPRVPPPPTVAPAPTNLAYAIYTSGSTGLPKGVLVEHRALLNLCHWHNRRHQVTAHDRATLLAAQSFDAAVWELWPYLVAGATVAVVDAETRTAPARLIDWMRENRITISFLPTPLAEALLAEDASADLPLRALLTGGEALRRRPPPGLPFTLINHYGPTECAVVATAGPVADASVAQGPAPIGEPIDNVEAHVLDPDLRRTPLGVPGELYLGGAGLARGYLGRPEPTAQRFIPDPYGPVAGARLYRTGDRVRWRNDGTLEFLGRGDRQLKIRGHRIEPGEIEARLLEHADIAQALVVAYEPGPDNRQLVGYIASARNRSPRPEQIRAWLNRRLPEAMVPAKLIVLTHLPIGPGGKIDRAALPDPQVNAETIRTAPRTEAERRLLDVWTEVFACEPGRIGVHDDFFDLGGHSLLASRIVGRIRQRFGFGIPLHSLFSAPTVARLAADVIEPRQREAQADITRRLMDRLATMPSDQVRQLIDTIRTTGEEQ